jgi:uncharacterized protein YciI
MSTILLSLSSALLASGPADAAAPVPQGFPPAPVTYYVAVYEAGPAWSQDQPPLMQPGIQEHFAYMDELHRRGRLVLGGPLTKDIARPELAGVLLVIDAGSLDEAKALVLADPGLKAGIMRLKDVHQFLAYIGSVTKVAEGETPHRGDAPSASPADE